MILDRKIVQSIAKSESLR